MQILFQVTMRRFDFIYCCISKMHDSVSPKLHHFLLYRSQNCSFNVFQKHKKLAIYNFESIGIINKRMLCIRIHNSLPRIHNRIHYISRFDLFTIIAFEILNFGICLTFWFNIFSNVIITQHSSNIRENNIHNIHQALSQSLTMTLGEISPNFNVSQNLSRAK